MTSGPGVSVLFVLRLNAGRVERENRRPHPLQIFSLTEQLLLFLQLSASKFFRLFDMP